MTLLPKRGRNRDGAPCHLPIRRLDQGLRLAPAVPMTDRDMWEPHPTHMPQLIQNASPIAFPAAARSGQIADLPVHLARSPETPHQARLARRRVSHPDVLHTTQIWQPK
jgi:hypothetical protein